MPPRIRLSTREPARRSATTSLSTRTSCRSQTRPGSSLPNQQQATGFEDCATTARTDVCGASKRNSAKLRSTSWGGSFAERRSRNTTTSCSNRSSSTTPGARTPADEVPTLNRWASAWTNPLYRFANDEDVEYHSAHAIDPRVAQWDLSSDPLGWAGAQLKLSHDLMAGLDHRWPKFGHTYDQERAAFNVVLFTWMIAALQPSHFVGGEYLSRAHQGDPGAPAPLTQVSRADERRAFDLLDRYVLSENAWRFSPATLNRLVYSEWEPT